VMATIFSHSIFALAVGRVLPLKRKTVLFWSLTAICAALPDIDAIGFSFGIHYGDLLGHRGLTHSLTFALLLGCLVGLIVTRDDEDFPTGSWKFVLYFFLITASHGALDATTNGGVGVAFFSPFSNHRYFFPWRPIEVSPIGLEPFLSRRGLQVIGSEIKWIWIPAGLLIGVVEIYRWLRAIDRVTVKD
jgi:inner membrane protein